MERKPLGETPFVHNDCRIVDSALGAFTEVGRASRLLNSSLGDYSYCERLCDIANTEIGKFSNISVASSLTCPPTFSFGGD